MSEGNGKVLRPADATWYLPERPEPKPETVEMIPQDFTEKYDKLSGTVAQILYDHGDTTYRRRVDLILEQRRRNNYGF